MWDASCESALVAQDGERASKAPKINRAEAEVRLDGVSALTAHNRLRGFAGNPGIWTELDLGDGKPPVRAKLLQTSVVAEAPTGGGGGPRSLALSGDGKTLELTCADGSVLGVSMLVLPGKKPVNAKAFWNGLNGRTAKWVGQDEKPPPEE